MADKNGKLTAWEIVNGNLLAMKMKDQVYIEVCDWELETIRKELQKYAKYKRAFEILKDNLQFENLGEMQSGIVFRGYFEDCFNEDEKELLEELMKDEQRRIN